ncbi:hypothetical protein STRTUCAR8_01427 [Streptomyces turgidiscabies Car8]|uniref:Uncharacterized protein n=1 Tax=Streptomyces turgidiscabies (strain Car8) TaxID=698760 RepID=L7F513_STRT8|nr:hypothetical protein STRTUCAR8_01427 [Streptomyces turgidiscabies Car8]
MGNEQCPDRWRTPVAEACLIHRRNASGPHSAKRPFGTAVHTQLPWNAPRGSETIN